MSFMSLLTLLFIGLKLANVIAWNWFWVLSPLWISFSLIGIGIIAQAIIYGIRKNK